ncbi:glutathione S-transferase family protein [Ectothiorhodospiraceae bacterium BW-2]|nr:glutathione S-transferase family protein [Ectothiorhodospiraceae bacterium BW-2]
MKPELISFKLCPFVQRSLIVLLEKGVDYDITYINLKEPPDWFGQISPLGKVPVLRVGETVLFESAVIMEYLDEISPPSLHPADPLQKAQHRAWIEFSSTLLMSQHGMIHAADSDMFTKAQQELKAKLATLEAQIDGPLFAGESLHLIDAAAAPLFMRLNLLESWRPMALMADTPHTAQWAAQLLQREAVKQSVVPEFAELYYRFVTGNGSFGGSQFATEGESA